MEDDVRYEAVKTRDARFDGRFFTAVRSTGIYCRPVCPARTPKRKNVAFYSSAAAAEEAGYRACRRCRPETAPGTPAWVGTEAVVTRALRLIDAGALDQCSVQELAARVGLSDRQLRRLFTHHLGAPPTRFALTRRTHFARRLLESTALPITMVAQAAGFGSVRRFNEVIRQSFARTPTSLRGAAPSADTTFEVRARVGLPYDFQRQLEFFALRAVPTMERITKSRPGIVGERSAYERFVVVQGHAGWLKVEHEQDELVLTLAATLAPVALPVVTTLRGMFDADADIREIHRYLERDPKLKPLVRRRPGLRVPAVFSPFEAAIRAIVGQQVSVKGATTMLGRIVDVHGARHGDACAFPTPVALQGARCERYGFTRAKAQTIRDVSRAFIAGSDLEEVKGVGPWTLSYVALRGSRDADAFPAGDLIIQRALGVNTAKAAKARAEAWRPFRAYGALHMWTHYAETQLEMQLETRKQ